MAESEKIPLIVVAGPTASGKTSLAVRLCEHFGGEVVSADSMQIYKGLDISTAKPDKKQMRSIPHHMLDIRLPGETFSVADYCREAAACIEDIRSRSALPVLAGGTGLYIDSLVDGIEFPEQGNNPVLRSHLRERADREGGDVLLRELMQVDPETAGGLHPNDVGRIIRALEIYLITGETMSSVVKRSKPVAPPYSTLYLILCAHDRQVLYDRIDRRVSEMLAAGLEREARDYLAAGFAGTSSQAIGCKELLPYFEGHRSLEEAADALRQSTRRYAKRQITWFGRRENAQRLYIDDPGAQQALFERARDAVAEFLIREGFARE